MVFICRSRSRSFSVESLNLRREVAVEDAVQGTLLYVALVQVVCLD